MRIKTYKFTRFDGEKTTSNFCTSYTLPKVLNDFIEDHNGLITIFAIPPKKDEDDEEN